MRLFATKAIGDGITVFLAAVGLAGVVFVATQDSVREALDVGDFGGFIAALLLLMRPLKALTNVNAALQRGIAGGASVFRLLDEDGERDTGTLEPERVSGRVEFRDVSFEYAADQGSVLRNIRLTVPAGQTLAIVGRSGSGKSSLVGLLPRFYDASSGTVLIDDQPVGDYRLVSAARPDQPGQPGSGAVQRHDCRQYRLRQLPERDACGYRGSCACRLCR